MATTITADEALQRLMEGNVRYIEGTPARPNQDKGRLMEVAKGQKPFAIILGCADSRVPAEILFDQGIGDIFVVRVAGNVAQDPTVIASLEFAVGALGAPLIMVLGHQYCGAVAAAVKGDALPGHLNSLVQAITPAVERSKGQPGDALDNAITANVQVIVEGLRTLGPILAEKVSSGALKVVGARYNLDNGIVELVA